MKQIRRYDTESGLSVAVEADVDEADAAIQRASSKAADETHALERFDRAISGIQPAIDSIFRCLTRANHPDDITVEFGLKFSSKFGAVITSADASATVKLTLKWTKSDSESAVKTSES